MNSNFSWNNKNVLVTGAAGLLGSWLIEQLIKDKAHVIALLRDTQVSSLFTLKNLSQKVTIIQGDLCDYQSLVRILNEYDVDTVFHLGAQTLVGYANRSPLSTFHSNIEGTWNLLEACRLSPWVKKIIVASSDKAYGDQEVLPYTEDTPLQGEHPYDVSKSCSDLIAHSYYKTYNLPVCITRCGNIFGGGDFHYSRIIPGTIKALFNNEQPIIRSNGLFSRDYIFVKDIVDGYMKLAESMDDSTIWGQAFNLSEEKPLTVLEVVQLVTLLMNKNNIMPIIQNSASGEILDQHLSCKKAQNILKWSPRFGFKKGLQETISWYVNYFTTQQFVVGGVKEVSINR
ncbi:MAG: CDP-glucose 4,6-dehydratase [Alteromonas naphthalenivorans]|jgi:CDP-glucose 4,6-dehydratase